MQLVESRRQILAGGEKVGHCDLVISPFSAIIAGLHMSNRFFVKFSTLRILDGGSALHAASISIVDALLPGPCLNYLMVVV